MKYFLDDPIVPWDGCGATNTSLGAATRTLPNCSAGIGMFSSLIPSPSGALTGTGEGTGLLGDYGVGVGTFSSLISGPSGVLTGTGTGTGLLGDYGVKVGTFSSLISGPSGALTRTGKGTGLLGDYGVGVGTFSSLIPDPSDALTGTGKGTGLLGGYSARVGTLSRVEASLGGGLAGMTTSSVLSHGEASADIGTALCRSHNSAVGTVAILPSSQTQVGLGTESIGVIHPSPLDESSRINHRASSLFIATGVEQHEAIATRLFSSAYNREYEYCARANKRRRFEIWLPLQFNDGREVPAALLEAAKQEILDLFDALSCETQRFEGAWRHGAVLFRDNLKRVIVDAPDLESNRRLMLKFKERWRRRFGQLELYMTSCVIDVE